MVQNKTSNRIIAFWLWSFIKSTLLHNKCTCLKKFTSQSANTFTRWLFAGFLLSGAIWTQTLEAVRWRDRALSNSAVRFFASIHNVWNYDIATPTQMLWSPFWNSLQVLWNLDQRQRNFLRKRFWISYWNMFLICAKRFLLNIHVTKN